MSVIQQYDQSPLFPNVLRVLLVDLGNLRVLGEGRTRYIRA